MGEELFSTISEWKREAARENNERYFFPFRDLNRLENGDAYFVIGRKGTGKTAIAEHLTKQSHHDIFTESLSFKSFPFHLLYSLKDEGYTGRNQYISLWKFVIYNSLCKLFVKNESINANAKDILGKRIPDKPEKKLNNLLNSWVTRTFGVSILGTGGTISESRKSISNEDWYRELEILEELVETYVDDCKYIITFDALDDDYQKMLAPKQRELYLNLITSLFKAIDDVRNTLNTNEKKVYPIAFLRDDIYSLLADSDKNKWEDVILRIDWNRDSLKELMAYRISRAISPTGRILPFKEAWSEIFTNQTISFGKDSPRQNIFLYLFIRTFRRPRDFIVYISRCAKIVYNQGNHKIDKKVFIGSEKFYSDYFRKEIEDELTPVIPQISQILSAMSNIRKATFLFSEFTESLKKLSETGVLNIKELAFTPEQLLQLLFIFNVIGNRTSKGRRIFRVASPDDYLNVDQSITIHNGLWKNFKL